LLRWWLIAGSSLSRSRSDVARTWSPPLGDQMEDKVVNFGDTLL
jgi:hypothetical protein